MFGITCFFNSIPIVAPNFNKYLSIGMNEPGNKYVIFAIFHKMKLK